MQKYVPRFSITFRFKYYFLPLRQPYLLYDYNMINVTWYSIWFNILYLRLIKVSRNVLISGPRKILNNHFVCFIFIYHNIIWRVSHSWFVSSHVFTRFIEILIGKPYPIMSFYEWPTIQIGSRNCKHVRYYRCIRIGYKMAILISYSDSNLSTPLVAV